MQQGRGLRQPLVSFDEDPLNPLNLREVSELSPEDEERRAELRKRVLAELDFESVKRMSPASHIDATLLRFLRARDMEVEEAFEMLKDAIQWRAENHINTIFNDPISPENRALFRRCIPHSWTGFDKEGHLIYVEQTGMIRITELTVCGGRH